MSLQQFLDFWSSPPQYAGPDPIGGLYRAYVVAKAELAELKSKGRLYIVPGKNSRGQWIPVFDNDCTDDIAVLSSDITAAKDKLKSICNDIEKVFSLAGGPSQINIQSEHEQLKKSIIAAEGAAHALAKGAIASRGRTTKPLRPDEVARLPEVEAAYANADGLRTANEPRIEELFGKLDQIREIAEKYRD